MVRLSDTDAATLWGIIDEASHNYPATSERAIVRTLRHVVMREDIAETVNNHTFRPLEEIKDDLADQLRNPSNGQAEGPILEAVIDFLKRPFTRNTLSAGSVGKLRKILLNRLEISELKRIVKEPLVCTGCGGPLPKGGLIGAVTNDGIREIPDVVIYCFHCRPPGYVVCGDPSCQEPVEIPNGMLKKLARTRCGLHQTSEAQKPTVQDEGVLDDDGPFRSLNGAVPGEPSSWIPRALRAGGVTGPSLRQTAESMVANTRDAPPRPRQTVGGSTFIPPPPSPRRNR